MNNNHFHRDVAKVIKTIKSCKDSYQIWAADKMFENLITLYSREYEIDGELLISLYNTKSRAIRRTTDRW